MQNKRPLCIAVLFFIAGFAAASNWTVADAGTFSTGDIGTNAGKATIAAEPGSPARQAGKIVYPWNAATAIVKAGESFEVWFNADPGQTINSVALKGPYHTVSDLSFTQQPATVIYDRLSGNTYNLQMVVTVPAGTPEERCDLVLTTSSGQEISTGAVKVIKKYKTDYSIFHMSDTHLCGSREKINGYPTEMKNFSALVDIANILGPEVVIVTGDIVTANRSDVWPDPQARWDYYYKGVPTQGMSGVYALNAAVFSIPGNHDYEENLRSNDPAAERARSCSGKAAFWNAYCGLTDYTFQYGDTRFIGVNNGWAGCGQAAHLSKAGSWLSKAGSGKLRVTFYHIGLDHLTELSPWELDNQVQLALIGHNHHRGTFPEPEGNPYNRKPEGTGLPLRYIANSSREHAAFNLFRVDDRTGHYRVVNPPQGNLGAFSESGTLNLTLDYAAENNGSSAANTATLVNRFDVSFPHARVRFVMPKGAAYVVSPGTATVEQAFDGELYHIVDVRVSLDAGRTTVVKIAAKDLPPTVGMNITEKK
jgi:predicted MPP superfamily phosphohydrolase